MEPIMIIVIAVVVVCVIMMLRKKKKEGFDAHSPVGTLHYTNWCGCMHGMSVRGMTVASVCVPVDMRPARPLSPPSPSSPTL